MAWRLVSRTVEGFGGLGRHGTVVRKSFQKRFQGDSHKDHSFGHGDVLCLLTLHISKALIIGCSELHDFLS